MKILITLALVALPAAAQACGMSRGGHGGCGFAPFLFCAVIAALGYWVLQHAAKETTSCSRRAGYTVGTVLIIIGLLGILCAAGSHVKKSMKCKGSCPEEQGMMMHGGGGGKMCDMDERGEVAVKVAVVKTTAPAAKKTK